MAHPLPSLGCLWSKERFVVNPRQACTARVTVVGFVCLSVCFKSHLTSRMSHRAISKCAYSMECEHQNISGDLLEMAVLKRYKQTANMVIFLAYLQSAFSNRCTVKHQGSTDC